MDEVTQVVCSVNKLKNLLSDLDSKDQRIINEFFLFQTLKFNKMDLEKAEASVRANLLWRKENNIEALEREELCPEIADKLPLFIELKRKDGGPLIYVKAAGDAIPTLWNKYGRDRLLRHVAHIFVKMEQRIMKIYRDEKVKTEELARADKIPYFRGIYDAQGFSFKHATCLKTVQFYVEFTKLFINYFPCVGSSGHIVNANRSVELVFRLIRPLVESRGVLVSIYGGNPLDWDAEVFDIIDLQTLKKLQERANALENRLST